MKIGKYNVDKYVSYEMKCDVCGLYQRVEGESCGIQPTVKSLESRGWRIKQGKTICADCCEEIHERLKTRTEKREERNLERKERLQCNEIQIQS